MVSITDRDAWLEFRRQGIGGSDIGALIGLSRYASPTSLFYDKTGRLDNTPPTERQRIGLRMEAVLREEFRDRAGLYIVDAQSVFIHPDYDFARCTVDGLAVESPSVDADPLGTVQFKTDGRAGWHDGPPANIVAQCVWEMGVTQLPHCWLVVMFANFRVETFEIPWDDQAVSDWNYMRDTAKHFWYGNVLANVPPPADDSRATLDALQEVFTPDPDTVLDGTDEDLMLVHNYALAMQRHKAFKSRAEALGNEIRQRLGSHTDLTVDGRLIASWRPQTARRVDVAALRANEPAIADMYTRPSESRVLRLHINEPDNNDEE